MSLKEKSRYKYKCSNSQTLKEFLMKEGFIFKNNIIENDIFFTDKEFEIIDSDSCLRLRVINNKDIILNFDGKVNNITSIDVMDFQTIRSDISQKESIISFLATLGFYKYLTLNIVKETYIKKEFDYYYSVSIDNIENVGEFVDFEIYSENDDEKQMSNIYFNFLSQIEGVVDEKINEKYRDYSAKILLKEQYKGESIKRILVELDKVFTALDISKIEESIKEKMTILNLDLIELLEQNGISVEIVYAASDELVVDALKKVLSRLGYSPRFLKITDIKEISVRETLIIEKQKKYDLCEYVFLLLHGKM